MKNFLRFFAFFLLSTIYANNIMAQSTALNFENSTINFGTIAEEEGRVTKYVEATNRGDAPIYIIDIATSCGCTVAEYSREPIPPGGKAKIGVTYDPRDRPGRFERHLLITTSDSKEGIRIEVIGRVTPRERTVYELYPFDMGGGLRMESNFHAFAYVEHGASVEERIAYINNSDREIAITIDEIEVSGALTLIYPERIAPHATGDITLCYVLDESSDRYGTMSDIFRFVVDGKSSNVIFSTYAIAVDNFTLVEDILAPTAVISKKIVKFGEILCDNGTLEQSIEIGNSGESPLEIRAIESDSKAVTVTTEGVNSIAKGETMLLTIRLDTALIEDRDNPFVTRIRIICNDPMMPMQVIKVNAIPL